MGPRTRRRAWLVLVGLVAVGTSSGAHAQAPSSSPEAGPPPFHVAGVVIGPAHRSAILVVLDDARREVGLTTLREGESLGGYRLAAVEPARVLLDQGGILFSVAVGRPYTGSKGTPSGPIFIPGPDKPMPDLEYTGPQVKRGGGTGTSGATAGNSPDPNALQNFIERLFNHPQLQQTVEEIRPVVRQRLERARADRQGPSQ